MHDDPPLVGDAEAGIGALLARTIADLERVARAEVALQKARALAKIDGARNAVLMLVGAVVLGSSGLTALVVGSLLTLTPLVGPLGATVIVVGVLIGTSTLLAWLSLQRFKLLFGSVEEP